MELASDSEVKLRRKYAIAAEAHHAAVRQFLLSRKTSTREERERLRAVFYLTKTRTEAAITRLFAIYFTP
jgi:hypothetical protein